MHRVLTFTCSLVILVSADLQATPFPQQSGDFVYIAGVTGNKPGTDELAEGIVAQVRQTLENVGAQLREQGLDFSNIASVNVFLPDTRHFSAMNEVYREYFPSDPPTRATVRADLHPTGALVMISVIAVKPGVERRVITPQTMQVPGLPYSWGILAGNTLFIAGATSRDPDTYEPVVGDVAVQTRQIFENIGRILRAADMDYSDVTSCNVFLADPRLFGLMNGAYREFFAEAPPARATVRAALMNSRFRSEIQCVAVRDPSRRVVIAEGRNAPRSPYSPAIQVGKRLYLAGMVGTGPEGFARGDVAAQTRQTLENLRATLAAAEMDFGDVVNVTMFVTDIRHYQRVGEAYLEVMGEHDPPHTVVGAPLMSPDLLVEIMMIAEKQ